MTQREIPSNGAARIVTDNDAMFAIQMAENCSDILVYAENLNPGVMVMESA
jgi:hypothetical protein